MTLSVKKLTTHDSTTGKPFLWLLVLQILKIKLQIMNDIATVELFLDIFVRSSRPPYCKNSILIKGLVSQIAIINRRLDIISSFLVQVFAININPQRMFADDICVLQIWFENIFFSTLTAKEHIVAFSDFKLYFMFKFIANFIKDSILLFKEVIFLIAIEIQDF